MIEINNLIQQLKNVDIEVRKNAIRYCIDNPHPDVIEPLSSLLDVAIANSHELYLIIRALSETGDKRAIEPLVSLFTHPDEEIQATVASFLTPRLSKDALPIVLNIIESSKNEVERATATHALAEMNSPLVRDKLLKLATDANSEVRSWAVWGLVNYSTANVQEMLIDRLQDDDSEVVRIEAVQILSGIDNREIIDVFIHSFQADTSEEV